MDSRERAGRREPHLEVQMQRIHAAGGLVALLAVALAAAPNPRHHQEWSPPSRQMPNMPGTSELSGAWKGSVGSWFNGLGVTVAAVRAEGEGGGARPRFIRFTAEMRPVQQWSDRNGDGRADLIEVYRDGALAWRMVDADYDGTANSLRSYDSSGAVAREERY
jgi:hypothetical protein